MLGRGVAERLAEAPPESLVAPEVVEAARTADLFVLNLECCISERGTRWPAPGKPFFFRAPPSATRLLRHLEVDCVTLANNHALDFGEGALLDTARFLDEAGIAHTGAGPDERSAREPATLRANGLTVVVIGMTDHPADFAASSDRAGVAFADLRSGEVPPWLTATVREASADVVVVSPHWGPNMRAEPLPYVRSAAAALVEAGATLVAGHSAHVFQGVSGRVIFDLGDFIDDYAVDASLRNDLGLLTLVDIEGGRATRLEAVPIRLEYARTRLADRADARWIERRFRAACAALGTDVAVERGRLVARLA
jgi:poly-gamma-glutamate capsule biosynthesis protein CapA/YwtB (metallophosphatase superfamily)